VVLVYNKKQGSAEAKKNKIQSSPGEYVIDIENYTAKVNAEIKDALEKHEKELDEKYAQDLEKKKRLSNFC